MKSGFWKRAIGLTFIYMAAFVLLVLVQFSRPSGFAYRDGRFQARALAARGEGGKIDKVLISFAGLSLELSADKPADLVLGGGARLRAKPLSIQREGAGVRVGLEGGASLLALPVRSGLAEGATGAEGAAERPRGAPEGLSIQILPPREGLRSAELAYFLDSGSDLVEEKGALRLEGRGGPYALDLPARALNRGTGRLALAARGSARAFQLAKLAQEGAPAPAEQFIALSPKPEQSFRAGIDAWVAKAWTGIAQSRWDQAGFGWKDGSGTTSFSERTLALYLAESLQRGSYAEALDRARALKSRYPGSFGYLTMPFLGESSARMQILETADQAEVRRLLPLVQAKDPSVLDKPDLVPLLFDRAPSTLAQDFLRMAAELDAAKLSLAQTVGLLEAQVRSRAYLKPEENPLLGKPAAAERLARATKKLETGYLLQAEDGSSELSLGIRAGLALIAYGEAEAKELFVGAGQALVEGALAQSDERGFLPARLSPAPEGGLAKSGSLSPEELYPLLSRNPYYPRFFSFYAVAGPGLWAFGCAPRLELQVSGSEWAFSADFPVGLSHYLGVGGMKPFAGIKLYGIAYRPDPAFESYNASGFLYRKSSSTLLVKMRHKAGTERIELSF